MLDILPFGSTRLTGLTGDDRLTAKARFTYRKANNWISGILVFAILALAAAILLPPDEVPYADIVGILIVTLLLFQVWSRRPIWLECNHCQKKIGTNTPWKCGFCNAKNFRVADYPFVNQCQECSVEPKAYECHHYAICGKVIFLTEDELAAGCAKCIVADEKALELPKEPPKSDAVVRKDAIAEVADKIEKARRDAELAFAEAHLKKVRGEKIPFEDDAATKHRESLGRFEYARQRVAEAEVKYKDDPVRLVKEKAFWKDWELGSSI